MKLRRIIHAISTSLAIALLVGTAMAHTAGTIKLAYQHERLGIMPHQEFLKLDDITNKIEAGGKVTDADLDFALALLKSKPTNPRETVFQYYLVVSHATFDYNRWTPLQKDKLLKAAVWLLSQPEPKDQIAANSSLTTNKIPAIFLLGAVHDKRCLPYLSKLEKDPNSYVANDATRLYKRIAGGKK